MSAQEVLFERMAPAPAAETVTGRLRDRLEEMSDVDGRQCPTSSSNVGRQLIRR